MKPLFFEYYEKRILIRHPSKNKLFLEYCLNDLAEEKTVKILEKFGFNQNCVDFWHGMTDVFAELILPYTTDDATIEKICNEIIKALRHKKYIED